MGLVGSGPGVARRAGQVEFAELVEFVVGMARHAGQVEFAEFAELTEFAELAESGACVAWRAGQVQ